MDYKLHYDILINRGLFRSLSMDIYTECHHIIPKCMNGTDNKDNLVELTPEEHYVAHQLLVKLFPEINGLICAAHLMCYDSLGNRNNNKSYGWIRRRLAKITGERFKVINRRPQDRVVCPHCNKEGGKSTMTRYHFENCVNHWDEDLQKINKTKRKCKSQSEETKAKRRETQKNNPPHLGRKHSEETKKTMSKIKLRADNPRRGIKSGPQPIVMCPHCKKNGGQNNMTKYHFDNCKEKHKNSKKDD